MQFCEDIKKLDKINIGAKKATLGTKLATLANALIEGKPYEGVMLTDFQILGLNKMCAASQRTNLGNIVDDMLKASAKSSTVDAINNEYAKILNSIYSYNGTVTIDNFDIKGFGDFIQWCGNKINASVVNKKSATKAEKVEVEKIVEKKPIEKVKEVETVEEPISEAIVEPIVEKVEEDIVEEEKVGVEE